MKNTKRVAGFAYYYLARRAHASRYFPDTQQGRTDAIDYSDSDDTVRVGGFAVVDDSQPGVVTELYPSITEAEHVIKKSVTITKQRKTRKGNTD